MNFYVFCSFRLGFQVLDFLSPQFLITRAGGVKDKEKGSIKGLKKLQEKGFEKASKSFFKNT